MAKVVDGKLTALQKRNYTTSQQIETMLFKAGLIEASTWYQQGADRRVDGARWGGWAIDLSQGNAKRSFHSWDTMTKCLREGFAIFQSDRMWEYEINALSSCAGNEEDALYVVQVRKNPHTT